MIKFATTFLFSISLCLGLTAQHESGWQLTPVSVLNTPGDEYAPQIGGDGLLYSRNPVAGDKDVALHSELMFSAFRQNGQAGGRIFSEELSTPFHEGTFSLGPNGDFVVFSRNSPATRNGRNYIYLSKVGIHEYQTAEELPFNDPRFNTTHPALDQSGKRLLFASDRPGGFGGFDLYYAEFNQGTWSKPINLGPEVNSESDEIFPFWGENDQLTFSSDRPSGLGGFDLYLLNANELTWSQVIHLGVPFSSEGDDKGITWSLAQGKGFVSSNRDGGAGGDDLYSFTFSDVAPVSWMITKQGVAAESAEIDATATHKALAMEQNIAQDSVVLSKTLTANRRISSTLSDQLRRDISTIEIKDGYKLTKIDVKLLSTQTPKAARIEADVLANTIAKAFPTQSSTQIKTSGLSAYSDEGRMSAGYSTLLTEAQVVYELTIQKEVSDPGIGLNVD